MLDPIIKVRHKRKAPKRISDTKMIPLVPFMIIMTVVIAGNLQPTDALCDKAPEKSVTTMQKISGDNGFAIGIVGNPKLYRPGQKYTITLEGTAENPEDKPRFIQFILAAEPVSTSPAHFTPMGKTEIEMGDAMVMYSDRCRNSIKESSSSMKDKISATWTAPSEAELEAAPPGSSGCLEFRAMVIERQDIWYMNDGGLTYQMCKDTSFVPPNTSPAEIEVCTACNEAKYELIFEGIWSRHTHPKDFPVDEWRTEFSKLIGASHSNGRYSLWNYGKVSSDELDKLARFGITRKLEAQMKHFSTEIRSVIKARGLEQRSNVVGQTFAVFRVDRDHHLLSFVTKMIPSPDWIVGVTNENLCLSNGSWTDHRVIDLYPADAGVDSGVKYNSPRLLTIPRDAIKRITSSDPDDPQSPFWDTNKTPMKPVARLHIIKQREYRKDTCPTRSGVTNPGIGNPSWNRNIVDGNSGGGSGTYEGTGIGPIRNEESYSDEYSAISPVSEYSDYDSGDRHRPNPPIIPNDPCMTTDWSYWSECSQTCGSAGNSQNRQRVFMHPRKANRANCDGGQLMEKKSCRHLDDCPTRRYGNTNTYNPFPVNGGDEENLSAYGYASNWERRGIKSGSNRIVRPGTRKSYVYQSGSGAEMEMNRRGMYGGNSRNLGRRNNIPPSNAYTMPKSYSYGDEFGGRQADEVSHDLPEHQPLYQGPLGDGSSPTVGISCAVADWGEWSECSSDCDSGSRTRNRHYINPGQSGSCGEELSQIIDCVGNGSDCPGRRPKYVHSGFGGYGVQRNLPDRGTPAECETAAWSTWSPCSNKCAQGKQRRTRLYTIPFVVGDRSCDVKLLDWKICWDDTGCGSSYSSSIYDDSYRNDQNYVYSSVEIEPLEDENLNLRMSQEDKCKLDLNQGAARCVSSYIRWFYDKDAGDCKQFVYKGCGGNQNNFESRDLCITACSEEVSEVVLPDEDLEENTLRNFDYSGSNHGLVSDSLIRLTPEEEESGVFSPPRIGIPPKPIDCQSSAWSVWTACSKSCGSGWMTRDRDILIDAGPGGRACPKKLHRKRKCRLMPCPADTNYWYQGSWRHIGQN